MNKNSLRIKSLIERLVRRAIAKKLNEATNTSGKWRADVAGVRETVWSNNAIVYNTPEEVKKWLDKLSTRWSGYDMSRVVPSQTPTGERIDMNDPDIYQNYRK